jgi:hypothetical protein
VLNVLMFNSVHPSTYLCHLREQVHCDAAPAHSGMTDEVDVPAVALVKPNTGSVARA